MPYPNEHACRLRSPGQFQENSFRRMTREHDGKEYSVIMGKLKGEDSMTEQAYRHDKDKWTAEQARNHCLDHDGRFDAAAPQTDSEQIENYQLHKIQANYYTVRSEMHEGKKHLVVPVVMMVEGVHNGSHGPLLHTIDELGKFPEAWNGIPACIGHPQQNGTSVSANSPDIIESQTVGRVYNTRIEGKKLKAEAWLDEEKLKNLAPDAYEYIKQGRPIDVSVGVFTEDDFVEGDWNGERYTAVAKNHRPDHLALLPGGVGACSWADGCGVRVNAKGGSADVSKKLMTLSDLAKEGYSVLLANEVSHEDVAQSIQAKLDRMDDDVKSHYLHAVFDDYFVYEKYNRSSGETELLKRAYSINEEDGSIEFTGEAVPVMRKVEYVTMELKRTKPAKVKGGLTSMADEKKPCCPEKINLLINSEHSPFEEKDKELLESFDQETIDKIVAPVAILEAQDKRKEEEMKEEKKEPQVNAGQAIQALKETLKTPEEFIKILPEEMQDQMRSGLKLHKEHRNKLIENIMTNSDVFTKEELEAKPTDELEKLSKLAKAPADYSVLGANSVKLTDEVLLPPGIGVE